ncbi:hypothetical protein [Herbaspirillum sp. SJZ099]|uniref:hypothetical protein n=1 Tax=Herbaspirillum sp. SJZ099 TaxID=2572916 RepID=UPI00119EC1F8|nr:hypothetical protein [Herbaspirillum sp. SJZ099]
MDNVDKMQSHAFRHRKTIAKRLLHMLAPAPIRHQGRHALRLPGGEASQRLYKGQLCFINCMNSTARF